MQETLHATRLLKLLDKMYKYEMDPTRTVGAIERTRDAGRTDGQTEWNQFTLQQIRDRYSFAIPELMTKVVISW